MLTVVFDVRNDYDWVNAAFFPFVFLFAVSAWGFYLYRIEKSRYGKPVFVTSFSVAIYLFLLFLFKSEYLECRRWLDNKNYEVVEGVVSQHDIYDVGRLSEEVFYVKDKYFLVGGLQPANCGPQISGTQGGVLFRDGMVLRIFYKPQISVRESHSSPATENIILRIELVSYGD